jgi:hypothetical protein
VATKECKGLCNDIIKQRTLALNVILDQSKFHNGYQTGSDVDKDDDEVVIRVRRGRSIAVAYNLKKLAITDCVMVVCCWRFASYLRDTRCNSTLSYTDGAFETMWERVLAYAPEEIMNLCAIKRLGSQESVLKVASCVLRDVMVYNNKRTVIRNNNNILLDHARIIPNKGVQNIGNLEKAWFADIKALVTSNDGYVYKQGLFTDLFVPI